MPDYFDMSDSVRQHELMRKEHAQLGYSRPRRSDMYLSVVVFIMVVSAMVFSLAII